MKMDAKKVLAIVFIVAVVIFAILVEVASELKHENTLNKIERTDVNIVDYRIDQGNLIIKINFTNATSSFSAHIEATSVELGIDNRAVKNETTRMVSIVAFTVEDKPEQSFDLTFKKLVKDDTYYRIDMKLATEELYYNLDPLYIY